MVCRGRVLRGEARVLERLRRFDRRSYFGLDRSRRRRSRRGDVTRTTVIRGAHCASLVIEERRKYVPTTLMNKPFHDSRFTPRARCAAVSCAGRLLCGAPGCAGPTRVYCPVPACARVSGAVQTVSRHAARLRCLDAARARPRSGVLRAPRGRERPRGLRASTNAAARTVLQGDRSAAERLQCDVASPNGPE